MCGAVCPPPPTHPHPLRYGVGSFFSEHVDRDRGDEHVGTLLLIQPTEDCEGGLLCSGEELWVAALWFAGLWRGREVARNAGEGGREEGGSYACFGGLRWAKV